MDPLSVTAGIIAVLQLSVKVLAYLNDVKDASKDRAHCAVEASNMHNLLVNLRFRLEDGGSEPWYTAVRALAVENGPLDQFKHALETLQTRMTDGGRLKKAGEALMWKFKKEEVAGILNRMERLKSLVEIALQMDHFKLSQAIKDDTNFVRTHITNLQFGVDAIRQDGDHAKHRRLLEWISPADYPAQQSDIIKGRHKGTCQWFLNAPEVARWLNEAQGTLFCPGIPGAGKTMIAAIAIDHLLNSVQNSSVGVAYVYCSYNAQKEQDASSMLAAILKQLVQARPSIVAPVERLHHKHAGAGTRPSLDEISSALRDVLAHYPTVYIVIDALDECRDSDGARSQFLAKLQDLQAGRDLRLMATSRPMPKIVDWYKEALRLEVQASREDVKRFVAGQTYRMCQRIQRDSALLELVQDKIVEAVDGMFLLARLHMDSLLDKRTPKEVKLTLATLSKGSTALEGAYKDAIIRIKGQPDGDFKLAQKVLSWISYAQRSLTTAEMCCALAVEPGEAELDPENILDVEDIVSVCAGLVVVDQESAVIRLVHFTTQEYFEQIRDTWNPGAQLYIATTCLTYLLFSAFESGSCSTDDEFEERLRQNKLLDYAAKHWGEHARSVEAEVANLACRFLLQSSSLLCATQVQLFSNLPYVGDIDSYPKDTALHCTARVGLCRIMEKLLLTVEEDASDVVNAKNSWGHAPLWLAAEQGHGEMAKLLLHNGADVNARAGNYGTALCVASERGHEQMVKLLLNKNADVTAKSEYYGNALSMASKKGHEQMVKLLLEKYADVNAQDRDEDCNFALQAASLGDQEQIVKLLLEKGADVHASSEPFGTALQAASLEGHEQIVRLLLDKGANVNARSERYGTALQAASFAGHEQIVRLLLDNGADVHACGPDGTALQEASWHDHEQIVKLLLDNGADVNARGPYGKALQVASLLGHQQVVELLLASGAVAVQKDMEDSDALYSSCTESENADSET